MHNNDSGWAALPGIPASTTLYTAYAVLALATAPSGDNLDIELLLNKQMYYPGDIVRMILQASGRSEALQAATGSVTEPGGAVYPVVFEKKGCGYSSDFVIRSDHPAGTDVVSVIATGDRGIGFATASFNVASSEKIFPEGLIKIIVSV